MKVTEATVLVVLFSVGLSDGLAASQPEERAAHLLFSGERTWSVESLRSVWYREGEGAFHNPESWLEPNYLGGDIYMRFEVLEKPTDVELNIQLCLWYGTTRCEMCLHNSQQEWFTFSEAGDVVYIKYLPAEEWSVIHGREWDNEPFHSMLFQLRLGNKELKVNPKPKHVGPDAAKHLPVKWKAEAYVVPEGESFAPPASWTGHPW